MTALATQSTDVKVILDGRALTFDVQPQTVGGRILIPLRAVFEALGAKVDWNNTTQTVTATKGDTVVVLTIGSTSPTINGQVQTIDQSGVTVNGRAFAPLRFVGEAFGGKVDWNDATRTVTITSGGGSAAGSAGIPSVLAPDKILTNGKFVTVDKSFSIAEAVAIKDGKIIAVGSAREIGALRGANTEVINMQGNTVLPGIIDNHMHFVSYVIGKPPYMLNLTYPNVQSIEDILQQIRDVLPSKAPGEWILGRGFNTDYYKDFTAGSKLTKQMLDAVAPNNPISFTDWSGHQVWANSKAIEISGVTKSTLDPPGCVIERDSAGEPSGIFQELSAMRMISDNVPPLSIDDIVRSLTANYMDFTKLGITSVATNEYQSTDRIRAIAQAYALGDFPIRTSVYLSWPDFDNVEGVKDALSRQGFPSGFGNDWLRLAGVKIFGDGIPPSQTAWTIDPYPDGSHGSLVVKGETEAERLATLREMIEIADSLGYQVHIHTTGDRAVLETARIFADVMEKNPWDARHTLIHGDFVPDEAMALMAKYGMGFSTQAAILNVLIDGMAAAFGDEAVQEQWPLRALLNAGVVMSNSSDTPVVSPDWRVGVYSAVMREGLQTGKVYGAHHKLTVEEAIRSYTIDSAWAIREDTIKGSIEPGKLADFCVLGKDILTADPKTIKEIPIIMTIVGGAVVFSDGSLK